MRLSEINFDGIVGPSHNYAGLSLGNLASSHNAGRVSQPRAVAKLRRHSSSRRDCQG
jgi:succinylarginine dihydrolase